MIRILILITAIGSAVPVHSASIYQASGRVIALTSDNVTVESSGRTLEFNRNQSTVTLPKELSVGDEVMVWYSLDAHRITTIRKSQPGTSGVKSGDSPIDDRAFYPA